MIYSRLSQLSSVQETPLRRFPRPDGGGALYGYSRGYGALPEWASGWPLAVGVAGVVGVGLGMYLLLRR